MSDEYDRDLVLGELLDINLAEFLRWHLRERPNLAVPSGRLHQLPCLAVAAGLHRYIRRAVRRGPRNWTSNDMNMDPSLLQIAAVGESIVSTRWDRLTMVRLLLDLGVPADQGNFAPALFDVPPNLLPHARTTLHWILNKRERLDKETSENPQERLSIVRLLLERGANPDIILLKDTPQGVLRETALQHCVRYESEDMVRLFLQHGASFATLDGWIPMNPIIRDLGMWRLLEEYGCRCVERGELMSPQEAIAAAGTMPLAIMGLRPAAVKKPLAISGL